MECKTFCAVFTVVVGVSVVVIPMLVSKYLYPVGEAPRLDEEQWWGKGDPKDHKEDASVNRMYVNLSEDILSDLKERLSKTYFFENLEGVDWEYGINPDYMREVVEYWKTKFDWRKQETFLNTYPHYKTKISGIEIHFVHYKPDLKEGQRELPIMMVHGWPGSFYEFYQVIPKLIAASTDEYAFSIICPSIPGYGFSEESHKPGFESFAAARVFSKLMDRLGYESYYLQGGDWGSAISIALAIMNPSQVRGLHVNMLVTGSALRSPFDYLKAKLLFTEREQNKIFPLKKHFSKLLAETGYFHIQATRPHSVALATNDSPAGLAAYILEKFAMWSGCQTTDAAVCMESCFSKDDLLTNVMIYWATHSIASSMRLYYETMHSPILQQVSSFPITVPTGLADFPHEPFAPPEPWVHRRFLNVVQFSEMPRGGHFAAFEEPELFANDVIKFVEKVTLRRKYLVMDVIRTKPLKVVLVVHLQQNNPLYAQSVVRRLCDDGHHIILFDCSSGKPLPILEQPPSPLMNVYQSHEELLHYKTSQSDAVILITDHPVHEVPNHLRSIMQHFSGHVYSWVTYGVTCSLLGGVVRNRQVAMRLRWLLEDSQFLLVGRILPRPCYFEIIIQC